MFKIAYPPHLTVTVNLNQTFDSVGAAKAYLLKQGHSIQDIELFTFEPTATLSPQDKMKFYKPREKK